MTDESTQYRKGDVVAVLFISKTTDGETETKERLAVIVSNDEHNTNFDDVLLIPIVPPGTPSIESCRVYISASSQEGIAAGLTADSVVDCTVIATIPKGLVVSRSRRFPESTIRQIDACIMRSIEPDGHQETGVPRKPQPQRHDTEISLPLPE